MEIGVDYVVLTSLFASGPAIQITLTIDILTRAEVWICISRILPATEYIV